MSPQVRFRYHTGLDRALWRNPRLTGSWDGWTSSIPMDILTTDEGIAFETTIDLAPNAEYHWGVRIDTPTANSVWAIMDEIPDPDSADRHRTFRLGSTNHEERYDFLHTRRLGANKTADGIRFAVWAPNARNVEVVFGDQRHGYIADDGTGIDATRPVVSMQKQKDGVWQSNAVDVPFGTPYMFRITRANGDVRFRTDLYSREQIGRGDYDPKGAAYDCKPDILDGTKSCSVIVDPEPAADFWRDEVSHERPLPRRIEDLVIYEVHIGALAFGEPRPGTLEDAIDPRFLDHLEDLGVNCVELLPMMEFAGKAQWGYGTSHFFALESSAGGRDALRRFVRACHQRGIAVLMDVVYNHYHHDSERAQWAYDSDRDDDNIYFWREQNSYVDNESTGYAPHYREEFVRKMFISSAVMLVEELHVDGIRVDQTTSIRSYNKLHSNGHGVGIANLFGAKFLRQLARTVKLVKPQALLIAEDHEGGEAEQQMTRSTSEGGLGFDAAWFAAFYHNLIGDAHGRSEARLLHEAGMNGDWPLRMNDFAGALHWSAQKKVVYGESHDEAGNAKESARTIVVAGQPRHAAEARCRFAFAMAVFSAGTPMFLSGDEIGAAKIVRYDNPLDAKEDLFGERLGSGANLFAFYSDAIKLRLRRPALRARNIEIRHVRNDLRSIAFTRTDGVEQLLVVGSLANQTRFDFEIAIEGRWQEIFNSDSRFYGGNDIGNYGATLEGVRMTLPANSVLVFKRVGPSS